MAILNEMLVADLKKPVILNGVQIPCEKYMLNEELNHLSSVTLTILITDINISKDKVEINTTGLIGKRGVN